MPLQINPDELLGILNGELQSRKEPQFALAKSISTILALPGLRGFWPMSTVGVAGETQDLQSLGNHLTLNGNPQFSYDNLIPYCRYDGAGDYHDIADAASGNAFDILGTETWILPAARGLTVGCWVRPEETGTGEFFLNKWGGGVGVNAYALTLEPTDRFRFFVSDDGTNSDFAESAVVTMSSWYHVVGKFRPGAFVDIFVNGIEINQATARASVFNTATNFAIGAISGVGAFFQGRISMAWVCAEQLSNVIIQNVYQQTRTMFNR